MEFSRVSQPSRPSRAWGHLLQGGQVVVLPGQEVLVLLELGDVQANSGGPAVDRFPVGDPYPAAVGQLLFKGAVRFFVFLQPVLDKLLLAAQGFGVLPPLDRCLHQVFEGYAGDNEIGGQFIQFFYLGVAEYQAVLFIVEDKTLLQGVQGVFQKNDGLGVRGGVRFQDRKFSSQAPTS